MHFERRNALLTIDTSPHPQASPSPSLGHDTGDQVKILFDMVHIFYLLEKTPSLGLKILEIDFVIEI